MHLKGFILEDGHGREFVVVCKQFSVRSAKMFELRGWQRRRLVPLHYSERELRRIVGKVLITLADLFRSLPKVSESVKTPFSPGEGLTIPQIRKLLGLRKVGRDGNCLDGMK